AQRITSLIALVPASLGSKVAASSFAVCLADNDWLVTAFGAKTDAKSTATDATSVSAMQVLKQISASVQAPPTQAVTVADGSNVVEGETTGAAVVTDADGTHQQYLRGLIKQWISSTLTFAPQAYSAAVSLTRTADAIAYTAKDVIGAAPASTAALTFASMGPSAGRIIITGASLEINVSAVISGMTSFVLHLYNVTPPSALGDNVAFDLPTGDRASYLGSINLGVPVDLGSTLYVEASGINKPIKLAGTSLFGYLVTVGAYTPSSAAVKVITLHSVAV
ncbi:MAG: hypothetical protein Q7R45_08455, partial [Sulfuricaulis sp.]|nr:hypothetical protein [Sulfuricaulis sp.]